MIDCHSHIIPGIDDGSNSMEKSIAILKQMSAGGVKHIFCTSHYMRGHYQFNKADYRVKFAELVEETKHQNIPITLYPGAEVFLAPGIATDIQDNKLTLAGSNYVLVETELNGFPLDLYKNLYDLLVKGYRPILAHAERYVTVMMKAKEVKELIDKNIYIQINAGSLVGGYGEKVKKTAWKLINFGWAHFLGSDDHVRGNYEAFFHAKEKIVEHVDENTATLLTKTFPRCIINNERVPYHYVSVHHRPRRHATSIIRKVLGI